MKPMCKAALCRSRVRGHGEGGGGHQGVPLARALCPVRTRGLGGTRATTAKNPAAVGATCLDGAVTQGAGSSYGRGKKARWLTTMTKENAATSGRNRTERNRSPELLWPAAARRRW